MNSTHSNVLRKLCLSIKDIFELLYLHQQIIKMKQVCGPIRAPIFFATYLSYVVVLYDLLLLLRNVFPCSSYFHVWIQWIKLCSVLFSSDIPTKSQLRNLFICHLRGKFWTKREHRYPRPILLGFYTDISTFHKWTKFNQIFRLAQTFTWNRADSIGNIKETQM